MGINARRIRPVRSVAALLFATLVWGTEAVEQEVRKAFPQARVKRFDADSTTRKNGTSADFGDI